jgi:hypothetical protein
MKVIKWVVGYGFGKYENFVCYLNVNKIRLNYFQHGYLTSTPNSCFKMQGTIQYANYFRFFQRKLKYSILQTMDTNSKYCVINTKYLNVK